MRERERGGGSRGGGGGERNRQTEVTNEPYHFKSRMSLRERERGGGGGGEKNRQTEVTNEPYHFKSRMSLRESWTVALPVPSVLCSCFHRLHFLWEREYMKK